MAHRDRHGGDFSKAVTRVAGAREPSRIALLLVALAFMTTRGCNCTPPTPIKNGSSLNITGPVALQGLGMEMPWCQPFPAVSWVYPLPCPDKFSDGSIPRWISGSGFSIVDGNAAGAPMPRAYTPQSQVDFVVPISFTDDTSALAVSYAGCTTSFFPGAVEGNSGTFLLTVQAWNPSATNCSPVAPSQNPDYPAVENVGPAPVPNQTGCWQDLGSSNTQLFGSSLGRTSSVVAKEDGTVSDDLAVIVELGQVSTYVRYVVTLQEGDSRVPGSLIESGWGPSVQSPNSGACTQLSDTPGFQAVCPASAFETGAQPNDMFTWFPYCGVAPSPNEPPPSGARTDQYMWNIRHAAPGYLWYSQALKPFQMLVVPMALVQTKVLPYTLLYAPPGDASKATYATTTSFGISMAADNKLSMNQSATIDNKQTDTVGVSVAESGKIGDASVGINGSYAQANSWDKNTKTGVGAISDVASTQASNYQSVVSFQLSNATLTPGASGVYGKEPFWSDTFVLLIHPQFALWNFTGIPAVSLIAAAGTPGAPNFFEPTIADLYECATQSPPYASGIPIPGTRDSLNARDCQELLQLDPFYGVGQNANLGANPRFVQVGGTDYGIDPSTMSDLAVSMSQVVSYTNSMTVSRVGSYTATVTDILSVGGMLSLGLSAFGITGSDKVDTSESTTMATDFTMTLQTSFSATAASSISISGSLDDHHGQKGDGNLLAARPHANVFQDLLFGSFAFQDPDAPPAPPPMTCNDSADCPAVDVCSGGVCAVGGRRCRSAAYSSVDCPANWTCLDNVCVPM